MQEYATHPWLKRLYCRLTKAELSLAIGFIEANGDLDKGAFEMAANRMFIDKPKPKNAGAITELLLSCNTAI